jgi:hypothetical protein
VPGLSRADQQAQLRTLLPLLRPAPFRPEILRAWARWDRRHGILEREVEVERAFSLG